MPSILSKKGDKIEGSNLPVIKRVFLKCVVHMHFSSETSLTHYLQHAYVLPFPSPSHDPQRPILVVCGKCPLVSSQPHKPNRLRAWGTGWMSRALGPTYLEELQLRVTSLSPLISPSQHICTGGNSKQCLCHHRLCKAGLCGFQVKGSWGPPSRWAGSTLAHHTHAIAPAGSFQTGL